VNWTANVPTNITRELSLGDTNKETEIAKLFINVVTSTVKYYWLLVMSVCLSFTKSFIWQSSPKYFKRRFLPQRKHTHLQFTKMHTLRLFCGKWETNPTNKPRGRNVVLCKILFTVTANGTNKLPLFYKGVNLLLMCKMSIHNLPK
jgi:hypothetical protein